MAWQVVVIGRDGGGRTLKTFHCRADAQAYVRESPEALKPVLSIGSYQWPRKRKRKTGSGTEGAR